MTELILRSAVPEAVLKAAAAGTLSLSPAEAIEVLVLLTEHPALEEQAKASLSKRGDAELQAVAASSQTPLFVLDYLLLPSNRYHSLWPVVLANPSLPAETLIAVAATGPAEMLNLLFAHPGLLTAELAPYGESNPAMSSEQREALRARFGGEIPPADVDAAAIIVWAFEHSVAIEWDKDKEFELHGEDEEEIAANIEQPDAAVPVAKPKKEEGERLSTLQKIGRMSVGDRVKLAMLGNKEERLVLIRDGSKVVSSAVLSSPKLSEAEVEGIAAMKNVQESVLRDIARNRKYIKNYNVVRNLVNNPRTPLDLALTYLKNLMAPDLRMVSMNKNVPETLRKIALKHFKEKTSPGKKNS